MTTTNGARRESRGPVTPPGRAICVSSPPGAPRRVRTRRPPRRPPRRPRSGSVRFSTSPRIGPEAFQRLLLASVGARSGTGGVSGGVSATNTAAASGQAEASPARIRPVASVAPYWVNTGFVVGFNPFEDDLFGPVSGCPPSTVATQGGSLNPGEDTVDVETTDATAEPVVDFLGPRVAAAVVVAAVSSSARDAVSIDPMEI